MTLTAGIIKRCITECKKSTYKKKMGAVLFNKSRIISSACNGIRYSCAIHPKYKLWANSLHAEQSCLIGTDWKKISNCELLVMRLNNNDEFRLAKPCSMCMNLIKHCKIKTVYYTTNDGTIEKIKLSELTN